MFEPSDAGKKVQKQGIQQIILNLKTEKDQNKVISYLKNVDNLLYSYGDYSIQYKSILDYSTTKLMNSPCSSVRRRIDYVIKTIEKGPVTLSSENLELLQMLIGEIEQYIEAYL